MSPEVWDAEAVRARLTVEEAADALAARLLDDPPAEHRPARTRVDTTAGQVLLMPDESRTHVGVKLVTIARGNPARGLPSIQGVYVLMDAATLSPLVVLDAAELTLLRTSAVSLLGIRLLEPVPSPRATVVGAGPQALAHVRALRSVDPSVVRIAVRDEGRRSAVQRVLDDEGLGAEAVVGVPVADSDLVVCATTSREPVFASEALPADAVVVAVGSHEPDVRELDTALVARCFLTVESREAARREAGDVVLAERETGRALVAAELGELVRHEVALGPGPRVLKTVGEAWEDLAVAAALWARR